ncbi:MAG: ribose 5-phosphate isomerase B [Candidatus Omnitrophica bacterium]|nr:ribose 5-phosphate isomerase B [Candidatus Omnitrophota bacterium]
MKKILIASDHGGFFLKESLKKYLVRRGFKVNDLGPYTKERCDYPEFAYLLAKHISLGKFKRGILICKSGIGNSIVANRLSGVRAALCCNIRAAKLSRMHNDSNILVLGSLFVNPALAKRMVSVWLNTKFEGGRHAKRLSLIRNIERRIRGGKS